MRQEDGTASACECNTYIPVSGDAPASEKLRRDEADRGGWGGGGGGVINDLKSKSEFLKINWRDRG